MSRTIWHRIFALAFALYLPLVTVGIPLHKHYCGGTLEDSQWLFEAESCHEKSAVESETSCCSTKSSCHSLPSEEEGEDDCCDNDMELYKLDYSITLPGSVSEITKTFITSFVQIFIQKNEEASFVHLPLIKNIKYFHPYPNGQNHLAFLQVFIC